MTTFTESLDGWSEPTIWWGSTPILQRCKLPSFLRDEVWPQLVRTLTAGPTIESARVVIETLQAEVKALREAASEWQSCCADLHAANEDLNAELTSLRRMREED